MIHQNAHGKPPLNHLELSCFLLDIHFKGISSLAQVKISVQLELKTVLLVFVLRFARSLLFPFTFPNSASILICALTCLYNKLRWSRWVSSKHNYTMAQFLTEIANQSSDISRCPGLGPNLVGLVQCSRTRSKSH